MVNPAEASFAVSARVRPCSLFVSLLLQKITSLIFSARVHSHATLILIHQDQYYFLFMHLALINKTVINFLSLHHPWSRDGMHNSLY